MPVSAYQRNAIQIASGWWPDTCSGLDCVLVGPGKIQDNLLTTETSLNIEILNVASY